MKATISKQRELELIWAIDVQTECLVDLKRQIEEQADVIQLLHSLTEIQKRTIETYKQELHVKRMEQNYQLN